MSSLVLRRELAQALIELEQVLQALALWQEEAPAAEALASTEPFCVDTLFLHQWLQFILVPRLRELLRQGAPLPTASAIGPMVAEAYRDGDLDVRRLEAAVTRIDELLRG